MLVEPAGDLAHQRQREQTQDIEHHGAVVFDDSVTAQTTETEAGIAQPPCAHEIGFRFPAHVEKVKDDPKAMQAIVEACSEAAGRAVRVTPVLWDALQQAQAAAAPPQSKGGHLLEEALRAGAVPVPE